MKIKLWTIQNESGWNELQKEGVLIPKEEFVEPDFKLGYEWMRIQMNDRIGKPEKINQFNCSGLAVEPQPEPYLLLKHGSQPRSPQ